MFKWLKKIMISIINTIKSLFVGDKEVQKITIGDAAVVYESGDSYIITGFRLSYSEGTRLYASGSNYAELLGTRQIYRNGTLIGSDEIALTPQVGSSSFLYTEGTKIKAPSRGTTVGSIRSDWVSGTYDLGNGQTYTTDASAKVEQQANYQTAGPGGINLFTVEEFDVEGNCEIGEETITINEAGLSNMQYEVEGYGGWSYTSGASQSHGRTITWIVEGVDSSDNTVNWISVDTTNKQVSISSWGNGSVGSSRSAYIKAYDQAFPDQVWAKIPVLQEISSWTLTFNPSGTTKSYSIGTSDTSFSISVLPKKNGTLITSSMLEQLTASVSGSTIGNVTPTNKTLSSSSATLWFSCSANTVQSTRTATITISLGDKSIVATVTQDKYVPMPSFFNQAIQAEGNSDWWIGTVNYNGTSKGIYIYCENEITEQVTVSIALSWKGEKSGTTYNCEETGIENTIQPHSSFTIGGSSRPGYWLVSEDAGETIDSSFTITEFDDTGALYIY